MTTTTTALDLDAIEARAAHLYEYIDQPEDADVLAGTDVPALVAEVKRLRAALAEMDTAAVRAIRAEASAVHELEQENARLRAGLSRPLTANERAFQDGV